jgi:hypothetical protein
LNKEVNKHKEQGVVVVGAAFPTDRLDFKPNLHIHLFTKKQDIARIRHDIMKKNPGKYSEFEQILDTPLELLYINKIVYPHYVKNQEASIVNISVDVVNLPPEKIYEDAFDEVIKFVNIFIENNKTDIDEFVKRL